MFVFQIMKHFLSWGCTCKQQQWPTAEDDKTFQILKQVSLYMALPYFTIKRRVLSLPPPLFKERNLMSQHIWNQNQPPFHSWNIPTEKTVRFDTNFPPLNELVKWKLNCGSYSFVIVNFMQQLCDLQMEMWKSLSICSLMQGQLLCKIIFLKLSIVSKLYRGEETYPSALKRKAVSCQEQSNNPPRAK